MLASTSICVVSQGSGSLVHVRFVHSFSQCLPRSVMISSVVLFQEMHVSPRSRRWPGHACRRHLGPSDRWPVRH